MPLITLVAFIQIAWIFLFVATHLAVTTIVFRDARSLTCSALGISPFLWLGITFSLPIIGMFIYWLMNYSSLSRNLL